MGDIAEYYRLHIAVENKVGDIAEYYRLHIAVERIRWVM